MSSDIDDERDNSGDAFADSSPDDSGGFDDSGFGGGDDGVSGLCVLWDSQEHAAAAADVIGPKLQQHVAGKVNDPPDARLFPVLAS